MKCERCEKEHDGTFGSGRFCSRSCANSRPWTDEQKHKVSESMKNSDKFKIASDKRSINAKTKTRICVCCGGEYTGYSKYKKCPKCKRKSPHSINPDSIMDLSKRTVSKILKRAKAKCVLCGWSVASCDIHHITERCNGGTDDIDNLAVVCPNCHRTIHVLGDDFITKEELMKLSIKYTFSDWKDYYHPSN